MKNKLIVIEGTDCSGKQTQSELLVKNLAEKGIKSVRMAYPNYDSPTGRIIAGPILGKEQYGQSYFDHVSELDPKVMGLYYAADRAYNQKKVQEQLEVSHVVLDRYVDSNMAHQGGKVLDKKKRHAMYDWFDKLEYGMLQLPRADIKVLLYMPTKNAEALRVNRKEKLDEVEKDITYLENAERSYLEVAKREKYHIIMCVKHNTIRSIEDIQSELLTYIIGQLQK